MIHSNRRAKIEDLRNAGRNFWMLWDAFMEAEAAECEPAVQAQKECKWTTDPYGQVWPCCDYYHGYKDCEDFNFCHRCGGKIIRPGESRDEE